VCECMYAAWLDGMFMSLGGLHCLLLYCRLMCLGIGGVCMLHLSGRMNGMWMALGCVCAYSTLLSAKGGDNTVPHIRADDASCWLRHAVLLSIKHPIHPAFIRMPVTLHCTLHKTPVCCCLTLPPFLWHDSAHMCASLQLSNTLYICALLASQPACDLACMSADIGFHKFDSTSDLLSKLLFSALHVFAVRHYYIHMSAKMMVALQAALLNCWLP
jgi:hypothetical protein